MKISTPEEREYYKNRYKNLYRNNWTSRAHRYIRSAKIRHGDRVTITVEQLLEQLERQGYRCYYTGISLNTETTFKRGPKHMSVSMDRLDNNKSYEPGNVVFCLWKVNKAKATLTEKEFIEMCESVVNWKKVKETK